MVPTNSKLQNSDFDPNHSLQEFKVEAASSSETDLDLDFDLGYLTAASSDCGSSDLDVLSPFSNSSFQPGSPSGSESFSPDLDSLTMFSPAAAASNKYANNGNQSQQGYALSPPCHVPSASPLSMAPSSPYSPIPGCRGPGSMRFSSTDTLASSNSSSALNFQENLEEFAELQRNYNSDQQQSGSVVSVEDTKLASVLSTVLDDLFEHVRLEIKTQCSLLGINPGKK